MGSETSGELPAPSPSPGSRFIWLLAWVLAAVYLVLFVVRFTGNVAAINWVSDYASGYALAETLVRTGSGGHTVISTTGAWAPLWFGLLTARLPLHRQLWEIAPTVLFLATAFTIGWSVAQLAGRQGGGSLDPDRARRLALGSELLHRAGGAQRRLPGHGAARRVPDLADTEPPATKARDNRRRAVQRCRARRLYRLRRAADRHRGDSVHDRGAHRRGATQPRDAPGGTLGARHCPVGRAGSCHHLSDHASCGVRHRASPVLAVTALAAARSSAAAVRRPEEALQRLPGHTLAGHIPQGGRQRL